jgi:hypothetical protein
MPEYNILYNSGVHSGLILLGYANMQIYIVLSS